MAQYRVADAAAMREVGRRLAGVLAAGDLVVLTGDLGAGKTTLTQGIGEGLGVRGQVASPTFIIARVHPSLRGGPDLVHVDAYRLRSLAEVDDLDLDTSLDRAVTVVEWGEGLVEQLAGDRVEVTIIRPRGAAGGVDGSAPDGSAPDGSAPDGSAPDGGATGDASEGELEDVGDAEMRTVDIDLVGPRWRGTVLWPA